MNLRNTTQAMFVVHEPGVILADVHAAWAALAGAFIPVMAALVPRLGVGPTILFAVSAQILTSALIDHFGLLGMPLRPVGTARALGMALLIVGLTTAQLSPSAGDTNP
jgi:uncharacterized membrane protein YdcZ (DUF606 family)